LLVGAADDLPRAPPLPVVFEEVSADGAINRTYCVSGSMVAVGSDVRELRTDEAGSMQPMTVTVLGADED
jgi:hypothetical protein